MGPTDRGKQILILITLRHFSAFKEVSPTVWLLHGVVWAHSRKGAPNSRSVSLISNHYSVRRLKSMLEMPYMLEYNKVLVHRNLRKYDQFYCTVAQGVLTE